MSLDFYLQGLGVPRDYAQAYFGFSLDGPGRNAHEAKTYLTDQQIRNVDRLVSEWEDRHQKPTRHRQRGTLSELAAWVVPGGRVELPTPAFSGPRSTGELPRHGADKRFYEAGRQDSRGRMLDAEEKFRLADAGAAQEFFAALVWGRSGIRTRPIICKIRTAKSR